MSAQPPGRPTESLFDNRYRYDHIYPRGRSGETLRAYDTLDNDRPVVIKRPAPQDAPPMRAGQEVSIRNERQALERLAGHPVLAELRGSGTFRVGGRTHDYIVMDLADGQIVEDMVLTRAEHNEYLPELEILVIVDQLLDLLSHAHDKQIVYNDVDAKHLFWDRSTYTLKVIDWGNAVFLDDPGALPAVNRGTDIYQCGELLYFILTGGNRLSVEIDEDGETFFVNFGPDAERIPARLQSIITRAIHPDPKQRFTTITDLRQALREHRDPLAKTRNEIISRVRKRTRATASQDELENLRATLQDALSMDPGYPEATALNQEITLFLRQIQFQADLDAIRIYLESANWPRALSLLHDMQPTIEKHNAPLIQFLIAATATLDEMQIAPPPAGFLGALDPLFEGDAPAAGQILLTTHEGRSHARTAQWLLAEHLTIHVPDVTLLRPHFVRLRQVLDDSQDDAGLALLDEIENELERPPLSGLTGLQVIYQQVADSLKSLEETLESNGNCRTDQEQELAITSVIRARRAANDILGRLMDVGSHAYSDPPLAGDLLHRAMMINPTATHFNALHDYFDEVHQAVTALSQFRPRSSGTNLTEWFVDVQKFLQPYLDDLQDEKLHEAVNTLRRTAEGWTTIINYLALGRRQPTIDILRHTANIIRPVNEHIAAWLGTLANRLPDTGFTEKLSPNEALSDLLIEGWKAWDLGDGIHAADYGRQAHDHANTDGERLAADRLIRLSELLDNWASAGGYENVEETDRAETDALAILLTEEERERQTFAEQMPNTNLYLRAMSRGIVAYMHQSSSAGWRALYMHYVLRGTLALFADQLEEAEFWREVASKSFDSARTHRAFQTLDRALTSRLLIQKAQRALNTVARPNDLEAVRGAINAPLTGEVLAGVEQALQMTDSALSNWSDGDFYAARQAFDDALQYTEDAITHANLNITPFVDWLTDLRDEAAELHRLRLTIEQGAATTNEDVDSAIEEAHREIVAITQRQLGEDYVHQVRQWHEMYDSVLETYTTQRLTRADKLGAFSRHFASLFITRHPAYPLFRHWETVIEQLSPDEDEDDTIDLDHAADIHTAEGVAYLEDDTIAQPIPQREREESSDLSWNWIIALAIAALIVLIGFAVMRSLNDSGDDATNGSTSTSGQDETESAPVLAPPTTQAPATITPTKTPVPTNVLTAATATEPEPTSTPFAIPTTPPTTTPTAPSATDTDVPALTPTPTSFATNTPLPTVTPAAVAAAQETTGASNILATLLELPSTDRPGPPGTFVPTEGTAWTISTEGITPASVEIPLSPDMLARLFQPGAASGLRSATATLELISYDEEALSRGDVAFGLGATNAEGEQTIGQAQILDASFVSLGLNQNGRFSSSTEFPQQSPQIEISIRRTDMNTISFYVDDRWLGDSVFLFPQGDPLTLLLVVTGRDVVVEVTTFEIDFSPRDIIP